MVSVILFPKAPRPLASRLTSRHTHSMPENRRKRPRDPDQLAKLMIDIASGELGQKGGAARASL
jgi:hypothetical protein